MSYSGGGFRFFGGRDIDESWFGIGSGFAGGFVVALREGFRNGRDLPIGDLVA